jgi:hypothetical protein
MKVQWHEPDRAARRRRIEEIWTPEGGNFTRSFEVRGHDALEERAGCSLPITFRVMDRRSATLRSWHHLFAKGNMYDH